MSSTIASRISQIIDYKETNIAQFERTIGASSGVIRKAIAQNSDIQSKWLTAISDNYPDISPLWLLTGRGGMLCEPPSLSDKSITHSVIGNRGSVKIAMHGSRIGHGDNTPSLDQSAPTVGFAEDLLASKELIRTKEAQISELIQAITRK